jgi:hypothetical protein
MHACMRACVRDVTHDRRMILSNKHALRRWPSMQGSSGGHGWTAAATRAKKHLLLGKYLEVVDQHHTKVPHACTNKIEVIMAERTVRFNVPWRPNVVLTSSEWNSRFLSEWFAHITALRWWSFSSTESDEKLFVDLI